MRNVVIIGSGPAGLTAAVYAARANLSPLLIEGWQSGGQLTTTTEVENYPGFAKGIMGPELMKEMRAQAERFGTEFLTGDVTAVDVKQRPFTITVDAEQTIHAKTVIIATGASAIQIGVKNEARLTGHGVSTCATCDGFFFKGKELIVVGGGVILVPSFPLVKMILLSQVVNGILLPFILIFMILLINKPRVMKEWTNSNFYNVIAWSSVALMIGLTLALVGISVRDMMIGRG